LLCPWSVIYSCCCVHGLALIQFAMSMICPLFKLLCPWSVPYSSCCVHELSIMQPAVSMVCLLCVHGLVSCVYPLFKLPCFWAALIHANLSWTSLFKLLYLWSTAYSSAVFLDCPLFKLLYPCTVPLSSSVPWTAPYLGCCILGLSLIQAAILWSVLIQACVSMACP
jgi:hypothetical protein